MKTLAVPWARYEGRNWSDSFYLEAFGNAS